MQLGLDSVDTTATLIDVFIPEDTLAVTSSFFLGLFGPSVRRLGEEGFRNVFKFSGATFALALDEGIRQALADDSPLTEF